VSDIRVTIGARLDRSVQESFAQLQKMGKSATDSVGRDLMLRGGRGQNPELVAAKAAHAEQSKLNRDIMRQQVALAKQADSEARQLARQRTREELNAIRLRQREERAVVRERERDERRLASAATALDRQRSSALYRQYSGREREIDRLATRTSHRATRFIFPRPEGAIGYATRTANDLMRGVGIDMSFGGGVSRSVARDTAAMELSQQEKIATGKTRGTEGWKKLSSDVGAKLAVEPEKVTELVRAFTGLTGDFDAAASKAAELASMTLASGANMGEMGSAAGYVYNQLKGMPGAAETTLTVMRGIVGQTAMGAVEMADYAKQMGRVAANAKMFKGDVSQNILELSALTQLAVAEGGGTGGADAARSIVAFANTTSKGQRINAFKAHGINLFEKGGTIKKPIKQIIEESFVQSKGNIPALTKMWADTLGQKPLRALLNAFNTAGGGSENSKTRKAAFASAWEQKVAPFMKTQLSPEQEKANMEERAKTAAVRAQQFQLKLDQITDSLTQQLLPALERLAPKALWLADSFASAAAWVGNNLGQALAVAASLAVTRAFTESLFRGAIDRAVKGMFEGGKFSGGKINAGGVLGAITLAAATFEIANATLNILGAMRDKEVQSANTGLNTIWTEYEKKKAEISGSDATPLEKAQKIQELVKQTSSNVSNTMEAQNGLGIMRALPDWARNVLDNGGAAANETAADEMQRRLTADQNKFTDQAVSRGFTKGDVAKAAAGIVKTEMDAASVANIGKATADGLKGQVLQVRVTNAADIGGRPGADNAPRVDESGRSNVRRQ
jgi:hypothetical protein